MTERIYMLNEERITLMTKLAAYEQRQGKKNNRVRGYFRGDYLIMQMLKSLIYTTVAYAIIVGMYFLYHFESLTEQLYELDFVGMIQKILTGYGGFVVVSCIFTYIVYSCRYHKAKAGQKEFLNNLKKLNAQQ